MLKVTTFLQNICKRIMQDGTCRDMGLQMEIHELIIPPIQTILTCELTIMSKLSVILYFSVALYANYLL
jgi:hypothetical protein